MTRKNVNQNKLATSVTCALLLLPVGSGAQVLEEIRVTAQKREQSLQDVGISVTAFSGDQIGRLIGPTARISLSRRRVYRFSKFTRPPLSLTCAVCPKMISRFIWKVPWQFTLTMRTPVLSVPPTRRFLTWIELKCLGAPRARYSVAMPPGG
jgi:hypothetical protein